MEILKLSQSSYGNYVHKETSSLSMCLLQYFLVTDIYCFPDYISSYIKWAQDPTDEFAMAGILTRAEKEGNYIVLSHDKKQIRDEEIEPSIEMNIEKQAFITLLTDWQAKVTEKNPKQITVLYKENQFSIETQE